MPVVAGHIVPSRPGCAHRARAFPGAPHERRARRDHATARYGRGGLSGRLRARRRPRPEARAADLHRLPRPRHAQRRRPRGARDRGRGGPAALPRTRLRRVPRDRLPRAHRHLRAVPDHRRGAQPHPTARADPRHPPPRDRGGHGHHPDGRLAQGRRGRDDRRGNPPRHPGRRLVQMPVFVYQAADRRGQTIDGVMEAPDARAVVERLQKDSYFPIRVVPHAERARWLAFGLSARVGQRDLLALTQQLATLVEAALPLDRALAIQEELAPNPRVKAIVGDLLNSVRGGSSLSEALAKHHPRPFSRLYINMVRAGEKGGVLEVTLRRLAEFLESRAAFTGALGTMLKSGVPVMGALAVVGDMMTNQAIGRAIGRLADGVTRGGTIAAGMQAEGKFPALAVHMVRVGEETGRLEEMLLKVADTFENDVRIELKRVLGLLEPAIILGMGVLVAFIVVAMLLAIFSINGIPL